MEQMNANKTCACKNTGVRASLAEHQGALSELLNEVHRVAEALNINYMLFAGTLLGAVRHEGFIPWDDDADVILPRRDYEKLLRFGDDVIDRDKFYLQKEQSEHWPMQFSKLRLNNTACIERYIPKDDKTHQGVYIDIFPLDNLADNNLHAKLQFLVSKAVIAKNLDKRGYITNSFAKKAFMLFCRILPIGPLADFVKNESNSCTERVHCFFGAASKYEKSVFPRKWFVERSQMRFGDKSFYVPAEYDAILTTLYGDYMTPTPESQRAKKVHAEIVDLANSYEMYVGVQKDMEFKELSRSIR